jgi:hypothetical protein
VVVVANGAAGIWALAAQRIESLRSRQLWWFTVVAQLAIFVEVILGVAAQSGDRRDAPDFHLFYGFVALITVALIYSYRDQLTGRRHLLYGLGGLFLMGLCIRAMIIH